jgi:hypothetical protein
MDQNSDWTTRKSTIVTCIFAVICVFLGFLLYKWFDGPSFYPTSVLRTDAEEQLVNRMDLSEESLACDAAVRSMLLAFVAEQDEGDGPSYSERASAAVESPYAIIPEECQKQIDDGFVISADGVHAELRTARLDENKIVVSFVLTNVSSRNRFALGRSFDLAIRPDKGLVKSIHTEGIPHCSSLCRISETDSFSTKIDKGRSVLIHLEGKLSYAPGSTLRSDGKPKTATVVVPIVRDVGTHFAREIRLSFNDIPLSVETTEQEPGAVEVAAQK